MLILIVIMNSFLKVQFIKKNSSILLLCLELIKNKTQNNLLQK